MKKRKEEEGEELPEGYYNTIIPQKRRFYREKGKKIYWLDISGIYMDSRYFSFDKKRLFICSDFLHIYPEGMTKEEKEIFDRENPEFKRFVRDEEYECVAFHPPFKRKFLKRRKGQKIYLVDDDDDTPFCMDEFSFDKKKIYNVFRDYPWELSEEEKKIFDKDLAFFAEILHFRNFLERSKVNGKWVYKIKDIDGHSAGRMFSNLFGDNTWEVTIKYDGTIKCK